MKLGYFTMPLHPPGSDPTVTLEEDLEQLIRLDELNYDEAWIGEHFTSVWENIPSPDLLIAQALPLTKRIKFGTGVSCMPNHNPVVLANRIAQLDHMAKGRLYWGIGSGGLTSDLELFDVDYKSGEQRAITNEAIETILQLWKDPKPGLYEQKNGKRWRFRIPEPNYEIDLYYHMKPFQQPHPPIGVAGLSPNSETLVMAGERGWMPMSVNVLPIRILKTHFETVESSANRVNRPADRATWRIARDVHVAETTEQARKEVLEGCFSEVWIDYFFPFLRMVRGMDLLKEDPAMSDEEVGVEYLLDNTWIVGDPDECARKLRKLHEDVGGFGVLLAMGHEWRPKEIWNRSMTMLAEEVMPQLRDLD